MTERWREKLEGIDQVGPSDDVYERAKAGPTLPEAPSPMQRTSTRVATAIAAFVVFALAISLFAIPTLRLHKDPSSLSAGSQLLPLWPARTMEQVHALQDQAGAGQADWALDPKAVATRFGESVLGWTGVRADPLVSGNGCTVASGSYPSGPYAAPAFGGGCPAAGYVAYGPNAYPPPGACDPSIWGDQACGPSSVPGSANPFASQFMTFQLSPCGPTTSCNLTSILETVELFQPLGAGEGHVWAVLEASSSSIGLGVSPGQTVSNGSSVSTWLRVPLNERFGFGVHVGASDPCSQAVATDVFHSPGSPNDAVTSAGSELGVNLGSREGTSCAQEEPGYVFVATSERTIVSGGEAIDPLQWAGGPGLLLTSFAAVPITFEWPDEVPSSVAPTLGTSTPASSAWTTYTDPLGWTVDVPASWTSGQIGSNTTCCLASGSASGAWFSSGEVAAIPSGSSANLGPDPAPGQVILKIFHSTKDPTVENDSTLPLDADTLLHHQGNEWDGFFHADGIEFVVATYTGDGGALSPQQHDVIQRMISSIAFRPWTPGESRNGFTALNPSADTQREWKQAGLDWQVLGKDVYVYMQDGGNGVLLGPMPGCGEGESDSASTDPRGPVLQCPDGTSAGWTIDGQPFPTNPAGLQQPLPVNQVIRAWDGTQLSPLGPIG